MYSKTVAGRSEPLPERDGQGDCRSDGADAKNAIRRRVAIASVLASMTLVVLDAAIVNVALPTMATALRVAPSNAVLIVTAYQAALVIGLLPCGALGERHGFRRIFAIGVALFTVASVACALSPTLAWLIAFRIAQGLGGSAIMALGIALLRFVVPAEQFGVAIGWNALTVALSSAAGPMVGAAMLSIATWPWMFAINLPIGLVALSASRRLPSTSASVNSLDGRSVAFYACAISWIVLGAYLLSSNPQIAIILIATAIISFVLLIRIESRKKAPLVPLDLLRIPPFRLSVIASVCCFSGQTVGLIAFPFYLHHTLAMSPVMIGLFMTPWPAAVAFTAPMAGRLANRIPSGSLCAAGAAFMAIGLATAAVAARWHGSQLLIPAAALCGIGFGLFNVPNNRAMFLSAPFERSGAAGGLQGTARLAGQTSGSLLMATLFAVASIETAPMLGFAIGAVAALVAGSVSLLKTDASISRS